MSAALVAQPVLLRQHHRRGSGCPGAAACPQLSSLDLYGCDKITDAAVATLAASCPHLSSLNLSYCDSITDVAVAALAAVSAAFIARPVLLRQDHRRRGGCPGGGVSAALVARPETLRQYFITDAAVAALAASCDVSNEAVQ